jgi:hypothetical protein
MAFMGWDGDDLAEDILMAESAYALIEQEELDEEREDYYEEERSGGEGEEEYQNVEVGDNEEYDDAGEFEVLEADEGSFDDELSGGNTDEADDVDE